VKSSDLFSQAWCDLIFQGRNKDYGAYRLRQRAGRRNRFALFVVVAGVLVLSILPAAFNLYFRYRVYKDLKNAVAEVREMKRLEGEKDVETKRISAGRGAPAVTTIKDASNNAPDIVEVQKRDIIFGTGGAETYIADDKTLFTDLDTLHNRTRKDLPIEGAQLVSVEVVEEMPQFPGGPQALMAWLDANIPYPQACIDQKIEGDMEVVFYVTVAGQVADAKVTKSLHADLDQTVLRAFQNMPRWKPGKQGSSLTAVCVTLPLHFQIR